MSRHVLTQPTTNITRWPFTVIVVVFSLIFGVNTRTCHAGNTAIQLEITTHMGDQQTFVEGDALSFFVNLDKDAYLLVIYEDASGQLVQILPNDYAGNKKYQAGFFIQVPDEMIRHRFIISPPFGKEHIYAFAINQRFPDLNGNVLNNGLKLLTGKKEEIFSRLRNIKKQHQIEYGEAHLDITTRAR